MKRKKRSSILRSLLSLFFPSVFPVLLILALVAGVLLLLPSIGIPNLGLRNLLFRERSREYAQSLLLEVRDIAQFSTVEYVYRTVFPFDFLPADLRAREESLRRIDRNRFYRPDAVLSGAERRYLQTLELCEEIGLPVNGYRFIVITARIRAGFDLQGLAGDRSGVPEPADIARSVRIDEESGRRTIRIVLPEPSITEVIVEDADSTRYGYPDLALSPEQWKRLSSFVVEHLRDRVIQEGILETARERGELFIRSFLEKSGFQRVEFPDRLPPAESDPPA